MTTAQILISLDVLMKTSRATKISKNSWATSATVYGDVVFPTNTKIAGGINN